MSKLLKLEANSDFRKRLDELGGDDPYYLTHRNRFFLTYDLLTRYEVLLGGCRLLELGEHSVFTRVLSEFHDVYVFPTLDRDLRYPLIDILDQDFDLVLSMEVFEHINDQNPKDGLDSAEFKYSGIKCLLGECNRVLKKATGNLFFTTPNKRSFNNLYHYVHDGPMMLYTPHIREYTTFELGKLLKEAGFETTFTTIDCYNDFSKIPNWLTSFYPHLQVLNHGDTVVGFSKKGTVPI